MKTIAVLGSTGSIGRQTLDVIRAFPDVFKVDALVAGRNVELLQSQIWEFRPKFVFSTNAESLGSLPPETKFIDEISEIVAHPSVDLVVQGMVGNVGLLPTIHSLKAGKIVALANKEPIVIAGELLQQCVKDFGGMLIPVDSEPSAIIQCIQGESANEDIKRLIITASGGPFRKRDLQTMNLITVQEALNHPTWRMGEKITIDSATLMNKAFEVIEAHWLFDMPWEKIQVVIHPESIIHSMVEFNDGSFKAQLGPADMRLPIQFALFYPRHVANPNLSRFDPIETSKLTFEPLVESRYPCFSLGVQAGMKGGSYPSVLSAADEVVVNFFLEKKIRFSDIHTLISNVLDKHVPVIHPTIEDILEADRWARYTVTQEMALIS